MRFVLISEIKGRTKKGTRTKKCIPLQTQLRHRYTEKESFVKRLSAGMGRALLNIVRFSTFSWYLYGFKVWVVGFSIFLPTLLGTNVFNSFCLFLIRLLVELRDGLWNILVEWVHDPWHGLTRTLTAYINYKSSMGWQEWWKLKLLSFISFWKKSLVFFVSKFPGIYFARGFQLLLFF